MDIHLIPFAAMLFELSCDQSRVNGTKGFGINKMAAARQLWVLRRTIPLVSVAPLILSSDVVQLNV